MEKSVAVRKLHKILGKGFGYRVDPKALKREDREKAKEELKAALVERNKARDELDARREEILASDQEYQKRLSARMAAQRRVDEIGAKSRSWPITVGVTMDIAGMGMFLVKAEGDNWQEVLDKVTK